MNPSAPVNTAHYMVLIMYLAVLESTILYMYIFKRVKYEYFINYILVYMVKTLYIPYKGVFDSLRFVVESFHCNSIYY